MGGGAAQRVHGALGAGDGTSDAGGERELGAWRGRVFLLFARPQPRLVPVRGPGLRPRAAPRPGRASAQAAAYRELSP